MPSLTIQFLGSRSFLILYFCKQPYRCWKHFRRSVFAALFLWTAILMSEALLQTSFCCTISANNHTNVGSTYADLYRSTSVMMSVTYSMSWPVPVATWSEA
jgi:hypothetical protein